MSMKSKASNFGPPGAMGETSYFHQLLLDQLQSIRGDCFAYSQAVIHKDTQLSSLKAASVQTVCLRAEKTFRNLLKEVDSTFSKIGLNANSSLGQKKQSILAFTTRAQREESGQILLDARKAIADVALRLVATRASASLILNHDKPASLRPSMTSSVDDLDECCGVVGCRLLELLRAVFAELAPLQIFAALSPSIETDASKRYSEENVDVPLSTFSSTTLCQLRHTCQLKDRADSSFLKVLLGNLEVAVRDLYGFAKSDDEALALKMTALMENNIHIGSSRAPHVPAHLSPLERAMINFCLSEMKRLAAAADWSLEPKMKEVTIASPIVAPTAEKPTETTHIAPCAIPDKGESAASVLNGDTRTTLVAPNSESASTYSTCMIS